MADTIQQNKEVIEVADTAAGSGGGETIIPEQPNITGVQPTDEKRKAGDTSFQQPADSTMEKPTDEEQKGDETSSQQPDSTVEQPIDPPISTTDDYSSTTDQQVGDYENEEVRAGRAPPRPGIVGSTPQTNDYPSL